VEDDCPDETEGEFWVSVNNIFASNVDLNWRKKIVSFILDTFSNLL
jgi:hypothetical protein